MKFHFLLFSVIMLSGMFYDGVQAGQISQVDFVQYRDEQYRFSIHYPRSWSKVETTHVQTRLKVVSGHGSGGDDLSVVVNALPNSEKMTPEEFLKLMDAKEYLGYLRKSMPSAKLIKHGPTSLSTQMAYYYITDLTHHVLGIEVPMRQIQVQTVRQGNVYTITFRTDPGSLPETFALFELIAAGFVFWPDLLAPR